MRPGYDYDEYDDEEYSFPPSEDVFGDYGEDPYDCYFNDEDYLDMTDVCSSNDCTGMVVSGPGMDVELEDYRDMYQFGVPKNMDMREEL